jgi:hypothetical protein
VWGRVLEHLLFSVFEEFYGLWNKQKIYNYLSFKQKTCYTYINCVANRSIIKSVFIYNTLVLVILKSFKSSLVKNPKLCL